MEYYLLYIRSGCWNKNKWKMYFVHVYFANNFSQIPKHSDYATFRLTLSATESWIFQKDFLWLQESIYYSSIPGYSV